MIVQSSSHDASNRVDRPMGYRSALTIVLALLAAGCGREGCVEIRSRTPLLAEPHPEGYPSSNPLPNRVLSVLEAGRYSYRDVKHGHDFMAYRVRLEDGTVGYVIHDPGITRDCVPR